MTIAFEVRVGHLLTELLADAFVVFNALQAAWAITAFGLEAFPDRFDDLPVFVQSYHWYTPFPILFYHIVPKNDNIIIKEQQILVIQ